MSKEVIDPQTTSNDVPIGLLHDNSYEEINRDSFVLEEEVATDKTTIPNKKTFKILVIPSKNHNLNTPTPSQFIISQNIHNQPQVTRNPNLLSLNTCKNVGRSSQWNMPPYKKKSGDQNDCFVQERRKKGSHNGKGLRHFSMKVCEKVKLKQITTYNEVADELVSEISDGSEPQGDYSFDQKNIRRRVYDALNVLMAMNIISKEKKEIRWIGLPSNSNQEFQILEKELRELETRIQNKKQQLLDIISQQIALKNLLEQNRQMEQERGPLPPHSAIQLPFIMVTTSKQTVIDCSISNDKSEFMLHFNKVFSIHDDVEVLKKMGLTMNLEKRDCSNEELNKIFKMLPNALHLFVKDMLKEPVQNKTSSFSSSFSNNQGTADESLDGSCWLGQASGEMSHHSSSMASHSDLPSPVTDSVESD